jgi:hypothetical protein
MDVEPHNSYLSAVVNFVCGVTEKAWPSDPTQYARYFQELKCGLLPSDERGGEDAFGMTRGSFSSTNITIESASWTALHGCLFSLNFFPHIQDLDVFGDVAGAYEGLRSSLIDAYGQPQDERSDQRDNRAATWLAGVTRIELYVHVARPAALQIGLSHSERNAIYEQRLAQTDAKPAT